jgi:hypothetical protein
MNTGNVTFNATSNGSWQLTGTWGTSAVNASQKVTLTKGALDTNGQTCYWGAFSGNNNNTRSVIFGASTINLYGTASATYVFDIAGSLLTFSGASSTIIFAASSYAASYYLIRSGVTLGTITINGSGTPLLDFYGTVGTFNRTGTAIKTDGVRSLSSFTVTGELKLQGNSSTNRLLVHSDTLGTTRTLTVTGATISNSQNVDFRDITFNTGGANLYLSNIVGGAGDLGGNSIIGGGTLAFTSTQIPSTTYTIIATATNGTITKSPNQTSYNQASLVTLTATPNTGYQFSSWSQDLSGATNPSTITMNSNKNITANFTLTTPNPNPTTYTITSSAGSNGTISPNGAITITQGSNQTYTITPNTGYQIASVTVDGVSQGVINTYTFSNITASHTISATFSVISTTIATLPELPREYIDTTYNLPTGGTTHRVHQGDDLQTIIDSANLGDIIILDAGATFTGNFRLPVKSGSGWLYIISSSLANLPEETRVGPGSAGSMPKIVQSDSEYPVLFTNWNVNHVRFSGIEFSTSAATTNLILVGSGLPNYSDPLWKSKVVCVN